jgi:parallel beta-helix repeat protein
MKKWSAIGIILLFVGTCIIPTIAQNTEKIVSTSKGTWLYVGGSGPGNYTRIQDAINDSHDNDTVFVFDDSSPYYESLIINTSITLLGENRNTTIIDGTDVTAEIMIEVNALKVTITELCIQHCQSNLTYWTVLIENSNGERYRIDHNIFRDNSQNTLTLGATDSEISNNTFSNNSAALILEYGGNHTVQDNVFINNDYGILMYECQWNTIHGNRIINSSTPLFIELSNYNTFSENILDGNRRGGIDSLGSCKNTFYRNIFSNNQHGIMLSASQGNVITENNFINNSDYQAISIVHPLVGVGLSLYYNRQYARNGSFFSLLGKNQWEANYWSDWESSSPRPIDRVIYFWSLRLLTRITGKPYPINLSQYDWHPAKEPYDIPGMT